MTILDKILKRSIREKGEVVQYFSSIAPILGLGAIVLTYMPLELSPDILM
jgi:hypothetical protein